MRNLFYALATLCLLLQLGPVQHLYAQCTPDAQACTLKKPTDPVCMLPDSGEMPPGYVGVPYDRTIYFILERQWTLPINGIPVTATLAKGYFDDFDSLPAGLTWTYQSGNPIDSGDSALQCSPSPTVKAHACIRLTGVPTEVRPGPVRAVMRMRFRGSAFGLNGVIPVTIPYRVPIEDPNAVEAKRQPWQMAQRQQGGVVLISDIPAQLYAQWFDALGRLLRTENLNTAPGQHTLERPPVSGPLLIRLTDMQGRSQTLILSE